MDSHSSCSGLVDGLNVADGADLELNNDQDEEAVNGERGLQKKKKKKKKNGSGSGNNKNRKPSNNKKKDNKEKLRRMTTSTKFERMPITKLARSGACVRIYMSRMIGIGLDHGMSMMMMTCRMVDC